MLPSFAGSHVAIAAWDAPPMVKVAFGSGCCVCFFDAALADVVSAPIVATEVTSNTIITDRPSFDVRVLMASPLLEQPLRGWYRRCANSARQVAGAASTRRRGIDCSVRHRAA